MTKVKVLFVCMGNICRSPAAEGVFRKMAEERGLMDDIFVDSAGTIGYHAGESADSRMTRAAAKRGYTLGSIARQVMAADLEAFDYVLAADEKNLADLQLLAPKGGNKHKVAMITDYHPDPDITHVPDPYYGGGQGFEDVLDILDVACARLLDEISAKLESRK